jgi:hypothetical protein
MNARNHASVAVGGATRFRGSVQSCCGTILVVAFACRVGAQGVGGIVKDYGVASRGGQEWTLSARPLLVIERVGPSEEIGAIHGVRLLSGRKVAIANGSVNQIQVFDTAGQLLKRIGRTGRGPGEFPLLWRLFSRGDTLIGIGSDARSEMFTADGRRLASRARPVLSQGAGAARIGVLADGRQVIVARRVPDATSDRDTVALSIVALEAPDGTTSGVWSVPRTSLERTPGGVRATQGVQYAPFGQVAAGMDRICAVYSTAWVVRCIDPAGRLTLTISRKVARMSLPEAAKAFTADVYRASNRAAPSAEIEAEIRRFRFAADAPVAGRIVVSDSGDVWISDFYERMGRNGPGSMASPARPVRWHVFDRQGRWIADMTMPARFYPYEFSRTYLAGVSFDDDDVERVTVWRVENSGKP